jgi:hypothetical protein
VDFLSNSGGSDDSKNDIEQWFIEDLKAYVRKNQGRFERTTLHSTYDDNRKMSHYNQNYAVPKPN